MKYTETGITKTGVHAKEASLIVAVAGKFQSDTTLFYNGKKVDAKSILGVMSLGIQSGATIDLVAQGIDALEAIQALKEILL
ncbi:MAG: HPr family phosphocarrier protein [Turicibacter sp.]